MEVLYAIEAADHRFGDYWQLVEKEFGQKIPWLHNVRQEDLYCNLLIEHGIVAGGVTIFKKSPESNEINLLKESVMGNGGIYASCFLLDKQYRGKSWGKKLFKSTLKTVFQHELTYVWGIVTSARLVNFYLTNFSAEIYSTANPEINLIKFSNKLPC